MPPLTPPSLPRWLLDRVLPHDERGDSIRGDLLEEMIARAEATSAARARRWYWRQSLAVAVHALRWRRPYVNDSSFRKASLMDAFRIDFRLAVRSLFRARSVTGISVLTLALGIGAATAVFAVVEAVLLRPLPIADPDRVVWMTETASNGSVMSIAWPDYLDWRDRLRTIDDIAAIRRGTMNLTGSGEPERLISRHVTASFFHVLGVHAARGRTFTDAEDRPGAPRVALISDGFWRRRFNADEGAIGRKLMLDDEPYEIVGILPPGFIYNLIEEDDVITPLGQQATSDTGLLDRGNHNGLSAVGRLHAGADEMAARRELEAIAASLTQTYPNTNATVRAHLEPLANRLVGSTAPTVKALFGAVAVLLLLATVNVANLLVARSVSRRHELSIRAALGCGRWRLVRQLLVESALIAGAGGIGGLLIAFGLTRLLVAAAPADLPRLNDIGIHTPVFLFALAVVVIVAFILSGFPAVQSSRVRGQSALIRAGRGDTASASSQRVRRGLMVVEVALAIVLLTGAGLMVRTMQALSSVDLGFDPSNVLTLRFSLTGDRWPRRAEITERMLAEARTVPGVQQAALTMSLPIQGTQWGSIFIVGDQPVPPRAQLPLASFVPVSADYFATMRMQLRAGRLFDATDTATSPMTVIVNETFARRFWPNGLAVGKRLKQSWPEEPTPWREIVGVVNDVKFEGVDADTPMQVYLPFAQHSPSYAALVVRTATSPDAVARPLAAALHQIDPNTPLFDVRTMGELMRTSVARQRMTMVIFGAFAILALVLAIVGLYGVVSHGVSERTREVGVRMALGATPRQVIRLFVRQGVVTSATGVLIGVATAWALASLVRDLLFHVTPTDPVTFWTVVAGLLVVSIGACYLPARRAARVSPTVALRGE